MGRSGQLTLTSVLGLLAGNIYTPLTANPVLPCGPGVSIPHPYLAYDSRHRCGTEARRSPLCLTLDRLVIPKWDQRTDSVPVPHRGYWGIPTDTDPLGAAENSAAALKAASEKGYKIIEVDVLQARNNPVLGHYFTMAAANDGIRADDPTMKSSTELALLKLRKRDQSPGTVNDRWDDVRETIRWAKQEDVVLMIDPKDGPTVAREDKEQYLLTLAATVINIASDEGAVSHIIVKSRSTFQTTDDAMRLKVHNAATVLPRLLWSPVISTSAAVDSEGREDPVKKAEILARVRAWDAGTNQSRRIADYETDMTSSMNPLGRQFDDLGKTYANLMDFIARETGPAVAGDPSRRYGRRSALWSIDPAGRRGTLSRIYTWKFEGVSRGATPLQDDTRANPIETLSYNCASHALITTDMPDFYKAAFTSGGIR